MMTEDNEKTVDGYVFLTPEDAKLARNELTRIRQLEEKMDYSDLNKVKLVYEKAIQTKVFKTQIGLEYLRKMQTLLRDNQTDEQKIIDIPITQVYQIREQTSPARVQVKPVAMKPIKTKEEIQREKKNFSIFINLVLALLVIIMFYMTTKSPNPNVLNYEKAVQDKYASWEEELSQREQVIREKEKELLLWE